jgi:two-component system response regulator YesN
MEHAKERITRQDVPRVSQIASEVGFGGNSQYFSQAFKKFFGVTPSEYIERNRSAHSNK